MTGTPPPAISPIPTAGTDPDTPRGNAAATIVTRKPRAVTGRGMRTTPSAATGNAGVLPPGHETRTAVGRRTGSGVGSSRSEESVADRRSDHEIHGGGAEIGAHRATHAE